jgi:hypothetical protein
MSLLTSLSIKRKITALFQDGSSKQNLGIPATVELLEDVQDIPVTVSGDEPSASELLRELAASANRKIVAAPDGLLLSLPVTEPVSTEPVQQPSPRTRRGDVSASQEPRIERRYQTLFPIFFNGSVQGQILSVFKARVTNPAKLVDYKNALANNDVTLGTKPLKKSLITKLIEMGIDPESE